MNADGIFKIVDRKKDMIIVSGFNVFPNEIEDTMTLIDKPHPISGETIKAYVVKTNKEISEIDIIKHCKTNLTNYKVPKEVEFIAELLKSMVGKILRKELRDK